MDDMNWFYEALGFLSLTLLAVLPFLLAFALFIFFILATPLLLAYGAAITALTIAALRRAKGRDGGDDSHGGNDGLPGVSVVIPFRNEERNLGMLLKSLGKQSYKGEMEVILVNDQSEDNGVDVINAFCHVNDGISVKIINLELSEDTKLTSKQQALDLGVAQSSHPLIAFTDADMILEPNWIESLVNSQMAAGADLVFGHTSIVAGNGGINKDGKDNKDTSAGRDIDTINKSTDDADTAVRGKKTLFTILEAYQLEYLFAFAYAFSKLGMTGSCMGNNVLITKSGYLHCGGQRGVGRSIVEDRALLRLFRKKKLKTMASEPFTTTARTYPSQSLPQFLNQMMRWARGGLRPGGGLFFAGLLLLTQNVMFLPSIGWLIMVSAVLYSLWPTMVGPFALDSLWLIMAAIAIPAILNFLLTWLFLSLSFKKHQSPAPKLLYPVYYPFMMIETVIFGFLLIFRPKINWKDRKL